MNEHGSERMHTKCRIRIMHNDVHAPFRIRGESRSERFDRSRPCNLCVSLYVRRPLEKEREKERDPSRTECVRGEFLQGVFCAFASGDNSMSGVSIDIRHKSDRYFQFCRVCAHAQERERGRCAYQQPGQKNQTDEGHGGDHDDGYRIAGIRFRHQQKLLYLKGTSDLRDFKGGYSNRPAIDRILHGN